MRFLAVMVALLAPLTAGVPVTLRVATYNASLNRNTQGQLATDLNTTLNAQARQVAEIIQRVRPDVLVINEFDVDPANPALARERFHDYYLRIPHNLQAAITYPHRYSAISNTGVHSGLDLDNSGAITTTQGTDAFGNDCYGFGWFPGQYSFVVFSKYPILTGQARSFQYFKWKDMPGNVMPPGYYSADEQAVFRLSSKSHMDLPIEVKPGQVFHLLVSHPTPPSFDGAEDRNGRRNHDEIRLWAEYLNNATWLYDDAGIFGGLQNAASERFIILGDLNADPLDGDSYPGAINQLRNHPLVNSSANPSSPGGTQQSALQGGINNTHTGNPAFDTADFAAAGNLRVDHVLPGRTGFTITGSGVFWPLNNDPTFPLISASDHRLVWLDLTMTPILAQSVRAIAIARHGADIVLTWGAQDGVTYKVEWTSDYTTWQDTPAIPVILVAGTATATDPAPAENHRAYRVVVTLEQ